ncbi:hypothetical protein CWR48_13860 [Oceanobacillus arenosus]|uniref:HTH cro/C1-type domain-containing protein n=1 Tax=Oceanobacillus arenosus TaxID=1229153 RepID=A0A3D8PQR9_9BACI|nr:helix-turn-helix transcriptional regulator [Oceanobacillus arenosus]RDW17598.1 hypothetical protein CWR48_13860 [Oceanobacillus arenosus]
MDMNKYVGSKIKEYRKKIKMNQTELGKKLGVNQNTISGYENGEWEVSYENLHKLASLFDIKINDFFPPTTEKTELQRALELDGGKDLTSSDINLLNQILNKALTMEGNERKRLLESISIAADVIKKNKD